mgnify:CR=1 FL=1
MERDVAMMQRMLRFVPPALKGLVDLERVISEFWSAAKEEMDFLREAANMETFSKTMRMSFLLRLLSCTVS